MRVLIAVICRDFFVKKKSFIYVNKKNKKIAPNRMFSMLLSLSYFSCFCIWGFLMIFLLFPLTKVRVTLSKGLGNIMISWLCKQGVDHSSYNKCLGSII